MNVSEDVTLLLHRLRQGEGEALDSLVPLLYGELRRIAHENLYRERSAHTLGTTALVNEAYLRLLGNRRIVARDRSQFFAVASRTMRRILVDYARARRRLKRGAGQEPIPLEEVERFLTEQQAEEVLALDEALDRLADLDERSSQVVQLRFFGGLTLPETATTLDLSVRTVQRSWLMARAWLRKEMAADLGLELPE